MDMKSQVGLRGLLAATLLPLMLLGLYVLAIQIHGMVRYDPVYFEHEYVEKYDTPGSVAWTLERALQSGDEALLAELQGRRRPGSFYAAPSVIFTMLLERTDRFFTYSYFDMKTFNRHTYHIEQVGNRYVVMQSDAYYYLHSGQWLTVFLPLAITWWALLLVAALAMWIHNSSTRLREQMYTR